MSGEPGLQPTGRLGSPKASTPSSPPSSGGVELPFQPNESVGQSSPPHSYRHSRAYRHFKNPPQPHMCIRVTTVAGEELFINVLSWTRIVIPQEPSDPIPLYGGMRVPPGSPRCPPLVYAVMANPEVLKDSGRHSKDPEERRAMVELMCDFVEAMNPDVKLTRNAIILKDRDISGELKDVWNAVQAQRDREREEQISQQQQHYHNMTHTTQQLFHPRASKAPQQQQPACINNSNPDNKVLYMEFGPESGPGFPKDSTQTQPAEKKAIENYTPISVPQSAINNNGESINNVDEEKKRVEGDSKSREEMESADMTDSKQAKQIEQNSENLENNINQVNSSQTNSTTSQLETNTPTTQTANLPGSVASSTTSTTISTLTTTTTTATSATTKKEKLGGFLPNGCHSIFPRFKNNKHKDKEKDKEKESSKSSNHSKEKTLLQSFKKSTVVAVSKSQQDGAKSQFEKNCLNLSNELENLDLNKLDPANDMLFKLKVTTSGTK